MTKCGRWQGRIQALEVVLVAVSTLVSASCAQRSQGDKESVSAAHERLQIGALITLKYPAGASKDVAVASIDGALTIGDRAVFQEPDGAFAPSTQVGAGGINAGADTRLGSLSAQGSVVLRSRARITGDVVTASTIQPQDGVVVTGTSTSGATLTPFSTDTFVVAQKDDTSKPYDIQPDQRLALSPNAYGALSLKSRATLSLRSGAYGFTSVGVEPDAVLELDDAAGPVLLFVQDGFTFRGRIRNLAGTPPALLVVQMGTTPIAMLDAPFRGSLVAPNTQIILGPGEQPHEGSFIAKTVEVRAGTVVIHRSFFRLKPVQRWSVARGTLGPFGLGGFDNNGGILTDTPTNAITVSASGAVSSLLPGSSDPRKFVIDPSAARFVLRTPTQVEVHDRTGAKLASYDVPPNGYAALVPNTDLTFVPEVKNDLERTTVTHARFYDRNGLRARFPAPDLTVSRLTQTHLIYSTRSELVRVTVQGVETWRKALSLTTFEISANGATLIGLLNTRGSSQIVHVDLATGAVGTPIALDGTFWNLAAARSGRFTVATTKTAVYSFDNGKQTQKQDLPIAWAISTDVSDQGYVAVGAQLANHDSLLLTLGPPGSGAFSLKRPVDHDGYRPAVRFFPGGQQLLLNESGALSAFDLVRTP